MKLNKRFKQHDLQSPDIQIEAGENGINAAGLPVKSGLQGGSGAESCNLPTECVRMEDNKGNISYEEWCPNPNSLTGGHILGSCDPELHDNVVQKASVNFNSTV